MGGKQKTKYPLIIGVIILLSGMSSTTSYVADETTFLGTIYVDGDNTEGPWDGTQEHPYKYVQHAIDNADEGDTVFVYSGNYFENIIVNKSIDLIGENNRYSVIKVNDWQLIWLFADDIEISNFKIEGLSKSYAIQLINSSYCRLHHNLLHTQYAVYVENCNQITIDNNTVTDFYEISIGIKVYDSNYTIVENNTFDYNNVNREWGGTGGVYLRNSPYGKVINNCIYNIPNTELIYIQRQMDGIFLWGSPHCVVADNYIDKGTTGITIWWGSYDSILSGNYISGAHMWGVGIEDISNSTFSKNTMLFCAEGFSISNSNDNLFTGNRIFNNFDGFYIRSSENNSIIKNKISRNSRGIYLGSSNNKIWKNNFISNVIDARIGICENYWDNNFWNRPRLMPKIILISFLDFKDYNKIYFDIDLHPASLPHVIPSLEAE